MTNSTTWRGMAFGRTGDALEFTAADGTHHVLSNGDGEAPAIGERAEYMTFRNIDAWGSDDPMTSERVAAFIPDSLQDSDVLRVAVRFSEILREWLTADEMQRVRDANLFGDPDVCASHDYCDSNMAMMQAVSEVLGIDFSDAAYEDEDNEPEIDVDLENQAWDIAKASGFTLEGAV